MALLCDESPQRWTRMSVTFATLSVLPAWHARHSVSLCDRNNQAGTRTVTVFILFYFIFVVTYPSPNTRRQTCVTQASLVIRKLMDRCVYNCLAGQVLHYVTDHWKANAWEVDGHVRIIRHLCLKFVIQYLARKRQRRSDRKTESVWQSEDVNNLLNFNHPFIKGGIDEEIDN